jgi:O-antigen/teichoic acid export membrane protein
MFKRNLLANFLGKGWLALVQLLFVPYYTKFLGIEAYGLVSFFTLLTVLGCLVDSGLGTHLSRELARFSALSFPSQEFRNLVRTTEVLFWSLSCFLGAVIFFCATPIAQYWFKLNALDVKTVELSLRFMGLFFALQLPFSLYNNALQGLQRQVLPNILTAVLATFRAVGAVLVLKYIDPSPVLFFAWQALMALVHTAIIRFLLLISLPKSVSPPKFEKKYLLMGRVFAGQVTLLTIIGVFLTYSDKIVLSKLLPLENFGYYSLSATLATGLYLVIHPIFSSYYPLFSQACAQENYVGLKELHHQNSQITATILFPVALILIFFSYEILFAWTGSETIALNCHLVSKLLTLGTMLNGITHVFYLIQLASGKLKWPLYSGIVTLVVQVPLLIFTVHRWGTLGAGGVWILTNCIGFFCAKYSVHSKVLKGEGKPWFLQDFLKPFLTALAAVTLGRIVFPEGMNRMTTCYWLGLLFAGVLSVSVFFSPICRSWISEIFKPRTANS